MVKAENLLHCKPRRPVLALDEYISAELSPEGRCKGDLGNEINLSRSRPIALIDDLEHTSEEASAKLPKLLPRSLAVCPSAIAALSANRSSSWPAGRGMSVGLCRVALEAVHQISVPAFDDLWIEGCPTKRHRIAIGCSQGRMSQRGHSDTRDQQNF